MSLDEIEQFAAQPQNLHIDTSIEDIFMDTRCLQQMLARQGPLRRFEKGQQQGTFALGQGNQRAIGVYQLAAAPFERPAVEAVASALGITDACRAPYLLTS